MVRCLDKTILKFKFKHLKCIFSKLYVRKIAFINMDINTVISIIEKMQQNLRHFNLIFLLKFDYPL